MDFLKMFTGEIDPNSPMGKMQGELFKEWIQDFIKSEKGKKAIQGIINQSVPAMEKVKEYMKSGNGKCFLIYLDDDAPAFVELDTKKSLELWDVDVDAVLKHKKLDNVGELIQSAISGELFKADNQELSATNQNPTNQVETIDVKAIEEKKD